MSKHYLLTFDEVIEKVPLSRSHLYCLVNDGVLTRIKVGRRSFISAHELERFVDQIEIAAREKVQIEQQRKVATR